MTKNKLSDIIAEIVSEAINDVHQRVVVEPWFGRTIEPASLARQLNHYNQDQNDTVSIEP
jgi:hypothetical protein